MSRSENRIKIYGERNTGTNYLQKLITKNLEVTMLRGTVPAKWIRFIRNSEIGRDLYFRLAFSRTLGWKHAIAPTPKDLEKIGICHRTVFFVTLTKNPYSWLLSLYRRPYHSRNELMSFEEFLVTPWKTVGRENGPNAFSNPVAMWNCKNRSYLELDGRSPVVNLRYEDLLADPESVIHRIANRFDVKLRGKAVINVDQSTKEKSVKDFQYYREYYLQQNWKRELGREAIDIINDRLDEQLLTYFGYDRLATPLAG